MSFTNKMNMNICGMLAASTMLLTACGGGGSNAAPAATTAKVLHFADIKAVLNIPSTGTTAGSAGCAAAACHSPGSVSLTNYGDIDRNGDGVVDAKDDTLYYNAVLARVISTSPASSTLLTKPSVTVAHIGNKRAGFDNSLAIGSAGRVNYDLFLTWIVAGAAY